MRQPVNKILQFHCFVQLALIETATVAQVTKAGAEAWVQVALYGNYIVIHV